MTEFEAFARLLAVIGSAVAVLVFLVLLDFKLSLIALLPVVLATACTLGTLALLGHPWNSAALAVTSIALGVSATWSMLVLRSYQRYGSTRHPALSRLLGRFASPQLPHASAGLDARIRARYRLLEPGARLFARFKLKLDPLFPELASRPIFAAPPRVLVDIGTGNGVPACWLAETFPGLHVYGIEPSAERVRVASRALGESGTVVCGAAPDLPPAPEGADGAFMLDMMHYLDDAQFGLTLARLQQRLAPAAVLVIRAVMRPSRRRPWSWWADRIVNRLRGLPTWFRPEGEIRSTLAANGFETEGTFLSGAKGELLWFYARSSRQFRQQSGSDAR